MSDPLSATVLQGPSSGFESVTRSHAGVVRGLNEDRVLSHPQIGLWAVADGMGGHQGGEIASAAVVDALASMAPADSGWALLTDAERRLQGVNAALLERAALLGRGVRMGSTVAALMVFDGHFACLWAGDSRAYLLRQGRLARLTRDHSVVEDMIEAGVLTPEAARRRPDAHVITRAVGAREHLELDLRHGVVETGDVFLLCSDGLTGMTSDQEIAEGMSVLSLERSADDLLQLCLKRGAPDNVSIVLVRAGRPR